MIASGGHIVVKLDGVVVLEGDDPEPVLTPGRIVLHSHNNTTAVQFRKIEIKELPSSPAIPPQAKK